MYLTGIQNNKAENYFRFKLMNVLRVDLTQQQKFN